MTTASIRCIARFASIGALIAIVQASHSFKGINSEKPDKVFSHDAKTHELQRNASDKSYIGPLFSIKNNQNPRRLNSHKSKSLKTSLLAQNDQRGKKNTKKPRKLRQTIEARSKPKRNNNSAKNRTKLNMKPVKMSKWTHVKPVHKKNVRQRYVRANDDILPCISAKGASMTVKKFFNAMHSLNTRYQKAIKDFVKDIGGAEFNNRMFAVMVSNRSVAERALTDAGWVSEAVPAGLQLGGYGMLKQDASLMFFHRVKLRNDTFFTLFSIQNDMRNMVLKAHLSLGDLHLDGDYERLLILKHPPSLYYTPTYGGVEFLLSKVEYNIQGHYRVSNGKLRIEQVVSNISAKEAFMNYKSLNGSDQTNLDPSNLVKMEALEDFGERIKIDLNDWVKDYFNDYLTYFGLSQKHISAKFQSYDQQKTFIFNDFVDYAVRLVRWRVDFITHLWRDLRSRVSNLLVLPDFTIKTSTKMTLQLTNGRVDGLSSIYRRSVATGPSFADPEFTRQVEAVVGFSDLKVVYNYETVVNPESPPLRGQLILTANDLTAHLALKLFKNKELDRLTFDEIQPMKVQTVTVEGPVNRLLASYRHVLENHITPLLTNVLTNQVKELQTAFMCTDHEEKANEPLPQMKLIGLSQPNINDGNDPDPEIVAEKTKTLDPNKSNVGHNVKLCQTHHSDSTDDDIHGRNDPEESEEKIKTKESDSNDDDIYDDNDIDTEEVKENSNTQDPDSSNDSILPETKGSTSDDDNINDDNNEDSEEIVIHFGKDAKWTQTQDHGALANKIDAKKFDQNVNHQAKKESNGKNKYAAANRGATYVCEWKYVNGQPAQYVCSWKYS